jgi:16S rRNA (uracil1498-N3)-methyltransferase
MRYVRIYQPGNWIPGQTQVLEKAASHHVAIVLRMQPLESLLLFNGENQEAVATIVAIKNKCVIIEIVSVAFVSRESPQELHLAQALCKGEKMELIIQKAVELGATSITPLLTERSVVKWDSTRLQKKMQQWQAIVISASEQCGRNTLATIHPPLAFAAYVSQNNEDQYLMFTPDATEKLTSIAFATSPIHVLIGPEGGFSAEEVTWAKKRGCITLSLGPRILRTETAAIVSLALLQALCADI